MISSLDYQTDKDKLVRFIEVMLDTAINNIAMCESALHNIEGLNVQQLARIENASVSAENKLKFLRKKIELEYSSLEK